MKRFLNTRNRGLTLIELILVIAILGIIVSIGVPAYNDYVLKAARSDAMNSLVALQVAQERHRLTQPTYAGSMSSLTLESGKSNLPNSNSSYQGKYAIAISAASVSGFNATAAPSGGQASDGCGTFAVDQDGPLLTGGYANSTCWRR